MVKAQTELELWLSFDENDEVDISVNCMDLNKIKPVLEKCKECEFEAKDANGLSMHIKTPLPIKKLPDIFLDD